MLWMRRKQPAAALIFERPAQCVRYSRNSLLQFTAHHACAQQCGRNGAALPKARASHPSAKRPPWQCAAERLCATTPTRGRRSPTHSKRCCSSEGLRCRELHCNGSGILGATKVAGRRRSNNSGLASSFACVSRLLCCRRSKLLLHSRNIPEQSQDGIGVGLTALGHRSREIEPLSRACGGYIEQALQLFA